MIEDYSLNQTVSFKTSKTLREEAQECARKNPEYDNESHFYRVATIKLLQKHKGEQKPCINQ